MTKRLIFTIIASCLVAGPVANAASCKYEVNEIDLFTKQHLVTTEWYSMTSSISTLMKKRFELDDQSKIHVAAARDGDQKSVALKIEVSDDTGIPPSNEELRDALFVAQGSPLAITLADKSVIVLHASKSVRGTTHPSSSGFVKSNIVVLYPLEASEVDALLNQNVSHVSVAATSGRFAYVDSKGRINFEMNRKGRDRFIEALTCLSKA